MGIVIGSKRELRALAGRVLLTCCLILSVTMAMAPAFAQSPARANAHNHKVTRGTKLGMDVTVVDPTNAVIRKANVTLSPGQDTVNIAATTDLRGIVRYRELSRGTYELIVRAPGFATLQQTVTVKKWEHLRIKLQIAVKPETVEVRATPGAVDTVITFSGEPLPYVPYLLFPRNPNHLAVT